MAARDVKIKREERIAPADYLKKATDNYEQMLAAIQADNSNAAATLAIQCAISSADAICVCEKGIRSISQDHFDVCDLVASVPVDEALEIVKATTRFYQWIKSHLDRNL